MSNENNDMQIINCQDSLDISIVGSLGDELKVALDTGHPVQLQANEVCKADAAALQLLCAFFLDAQAHGINIEWINPSDELRRAASATGLSQHLSLQEMPLH